MTKDEWFTRVNKYGFAPMMYAVDWSHEGGVLTMHAHQADWVTLAIEAGLLYKVKNGYVPAYEYSYFDQLRLAAGS